MKRKPKYLELHANPQALFDDCYVLLFPFLKKEIWIGDGDHCGYRIRAEKTAKGLCLHITNFDGSPAMTVFNDNHKKPVVEGLDEVKICQYGNGEKPPRSRWRRRKSTDFRGVLDDPESR